MVKAMRSLPGEQREIKLKPWLYRVAHNESIDLMRRRREGSSLEATQPTATLEIAETAALREQLGRLLGDLEQLPARQRSALVMRELGGLDYSQIAAAFETSNAVARQTVYEARLNLRELEAGREMSCEQVTRQLSEADGRVLRRRDVQAHLRACAECRAFRDSIASRREDLAALAPLPAVAAGAILHSLAGGQIASGGGVGGGAVGAASAGAGKAVGTSAALKAVATVAVVATAGVTAADRGGLIDAGLPGGNTGAAAVSGSQPGSESTDSVSAAERAARESSGAAPPEDGSDKRAGGHSGGGVSTHRAAKTGKPETAAPATPEAKPLPASPSPNASPGASSGAGASRPPKSLPAASAHGQATAAAHKAGGSQSTPPGHAPPGARGHSAAAHANNSEGGKKEGAEEEGEGPPGSAGEEQSGPGKGKGKGQSSEPPAKGKEKAPPSP
jgi:RNA polymerase sigma factor (sigma-70 family)